MFARSTNVRTIFLYLILIVTLHIKTVHSFGNNCFAPSTDLCTLLVLFSVAVQRCCSLPFRFPLDCVWTHCKLFVTFNMGIAFTWIKTRWYRFALPAATAILWQRCHNVVVDVVITLWHGRKWELYQRQFPTLWQRRSPTLSRRCLNVATTSPQH